jgi:hypothetical protein
MAANKMDEILKHFPDLEEGWKEMEEKLKKVPAEREMLSLRYRKMLEMEKLKENLPEPEFTKAKRAEPASEEKVDIEQYARNEADKFASKEYEYYNDIGLLKKGFYWGCKAGANYVLKQIEQLIYEKHVGGNLPLFDLTHLIDKLKEK